MNKHLALFFNQVGIKTYPKKSIAFLFAAFFINEINFSVVSLTNYYYDVDDIYYYLTIWLDIVLYPAVYLTVTGVFYFLADFRFEDRTNQSRQLNT